MGRREEGGCVEGNQRDGGRKEKEDLGSRLKEDGHRRGHRG